MSKSDNQPWRSKKRLQSLYVEKGLTQEEVGARLGCTRDTVRKWLREYEIETGGVPERTAPEEVRNRGKLLKLRDDGLSQKEIAERVGCSASTVSRWMERHNIEPVYEQKSIDPTDSDAFLRAMEERRRSSSKGANFRTNKRGYEEWNGRLGVHRLAAAAWFGVDEAGDKTVHHKNGIRWDNREENLETLSRQEHGAQHPPRNINFSRKELKALLRLIERSDVESAELSSLKRKVRKRVDEPE